jgi:GT2 family glycosyltransferase
VREATRLGLAGTFVFSWTDDWHTGGHAINDWAFGITHADRLPKASYHALRETFEQPVSALLDKAPRVSVVVCTYNGGRTLDQCVRSLRAIDYPDYELIVVDDGSIDETPAILARYPDVRTIRQQNLGLSAARNAGLQAATGEIVAYTDSDCFVEPTWLAHLVDQLEHTGAAAVGGPNLTPDDGWLAACVAASPGQPTHVLESDQVAEHVPGCNMAFRRDALLAINGFDPQYRKAGDDVDICWRLQQAGEWITFAPGACVWHHRRQTPRKYLRQQSGYGEAEGLLQFKHPDKFNGRGHSKWRGSLYGASLQGLRLDGAIIYRGTFGSALFQCLYQPAPAHWAMLPSTLEWHLAALTIVCFGLIWPAGWNVAAAMLVLSLGVAALQALQARLDRRYGGLKSRLVVLALSYAQPLVRSWARYSTRLLKYQAPKAEPGIPHNTRGRVRIAGWLEESYWSEHGRDRMELLARLMAYLTAERWSRVIDSGWSEWDVDVYCHRWTIVRIRTAQEEHGGGRRLIRVAYSLRICPWVRVLFAGAGLAALVAVIWPSGPCAVIASALAIAAMAIWWRGTKEAPKAASAVGVVASQMGLLRCEAATSAAACEPA